MQKKENIPSKGASSESKDFTGFNIKINEFGEVICSHNMDDINDFLDVNVEDKKLKSRKDDRS